MFRSTVQHMVRSAVPEWNHVSTFIIEECFSGFFFSLFCFFSFFFVFCFVFGFGFGFGFGFWFLVFGFWFGFVSLSFSKTHLVHAAHF